MKRLTIVRDHWLRGTQPSALLLWYPENEGGAMMCCLGFEALRCGFNKNDIDQVASPANLSARHKEDGKGASLRHLVDSTGMQNTNVVKALMCINDAPIGVYRHHSSEISTLLGFTNPFKLDSEEQREELIAKLFAMIDTEVTFV